MPLMNIDLIGVPFDGYGRTGHQDYAATVLRETGLVEAVRPHDLRDRGDLRLPPGESVRGAQTNLLNEPALMEMTDQLNMRVAESLGAHRFPVVVGGDCSLLLGVVTGVRDALGRIGLLFIDGHEDTMPLDVVEDGEAANCQIGLLLGLTGRQLAGPLAGKLPALDRHRLAMIGQRDEEWRRRFNVGSLADVGVWSRDLDQMHGCPENSGRGAAEHLRRHADGWWLHVDLDVLDPVVFSAQGLPDYPDEPGGLDMAQLKAVLGGAVRAGDCVGMSVTIYDPAQDPDRSDAEAVIGLIGETLRECAHNSHHS